MITLLKRHRRRVLHRRLQAEARAAAVSSMIVDMHEVADLQHKIAYGYCPEEALHG